MCPILQDEEDEDEAAELKRLQNSCELVWEGVALRPTFYNFRTEECYSASMARKFLTSHGVAHYCTHSSRNGLFTSMYNPIIALS